MEYDVDGFQTCLNAEIGNMKLISEGQIRGGKSKKWFRLKNKNR